MMLRHLTWSGRAEAIWYAIRRRFVRPAPAVDRCIMGGTVGPEIHCPRRAVPPDGLWCERHNPSRGEPA